MPTSPPISPCSKTTIQASSSLGGGQTPLASEHSGDLASEPCPGWQHPIWGGSSQLAGRQTGSREQGPEPAPWYNATQRLKGVRKNRARKNTEVEEEAAAKEPSEPLKLCNAAIWAHTQTDYQHQQSHHLIQPSTDSDVSYIILSNFFCFRCCFSSPC